MGKHLLWGGVETVYKLLSPPLRAAVGPVTQHCLLCYGFRSDREGGDGNGKLFRFRLRAAAGALISVIHSWGKSHT